MEENSLKCGLKSGSRKNTVFNTDIGLEHIKERYDSLKIDDEGGENVVIEILQREIIYVWYYFTVQLQQIFRYWVLGKMIGSAVSVFARDRIQTLPCDI